MDGAVRDHCHECDEFTARLTDISIGGSGAPTGYSMILIRTIKGNEIMNSVISDGYIDKLIVPADQISEWKPKKLNWLRKMTALKTKK